MSLPREQFFETMEQQGLALTYDDVRLVTGPSEVTAAEVDISSYFSRNVRVLAPFISAAMDTVTTADMAIAMAKMGGVGVIHSSMTAKEQGAQVRRVKHELSGLIEEPITVNSSNSLGEVLEECARRGFDFRTFPVVDDYGVFRGLLTQNDFDLCLGDRSVKIGDIMTPALDVVTGVAGQSPSEAFSIMKASKKKTLPLINDEGKVVGLYVLSDVVRTLSGNPEQFNLDSKGRLVVAAAVPTNESALERIEAMLGYLDVVVLDSAQGDSRFAFETLKLIKNTYPNLDVVAGNISSGESAKKLVDTGADGVKVGQGPGSICTTRIETGIGTPQVTAVYECVKAIRGSGVPVCADGGIANRGDVPIAIGAGAHTVMMGSQLAGTKEAPGEILIRDGQRVQLYRGMGSASALADSEASRARYGGRVLPEGVESVVPYRGNVAEVLTLFRSALAKGMAYVGSPDIEAHRQNARFVRITGSGMRESRPHDVGVLKP